MTEHAPDGPDSAPDGSESATDEADSTPDESDGTPDETPTASTDAEAATDGTGPRPNVLLIHSHDLGRYLGCYGAAIETPTLSAFAEEGALFEQQFATAPQCTPSRGSMMTGRHPHVNGLMGLAHGSWELHDDERVMPQILGDAGYETHLFGLQHISQDTDALGYDHIHSEKNLYPGVSPAVHEANRARTVAEVVSSYLEEGAYESPFFASVGFFEIHRVESGGRFCFDPDHYETDDPAEIRPLTYLPDRRGIRHDVAEMHGMVYAVDDAMATILETLERTGLDEETLVIFTTEHGIAFPRAKGSCYDAGLEAALIMRYPGIADDGERYDELLSNVDLLPTILDIVDVEVPDDVDMAGRSFLPLLTGDEYEERERVFAEMTWHDMYNPVRAIRTDQFKYVRNFWHLPAVYLSADVYASEAGREVREVYGQPTRPFEELYDLRETPQEDENVVYEPRYQDVRVDLARELHEWMVETDDPLLDGPVVPGDFEDVQAWPHQLQEE